MHHKIVALDAWHVSIPADLIKLPAPHTYQLVTCDKRLTSRHDIQQRVKDANIIVTTISPLDASTLAHVTTPNLKLVVAIASGTDNIDKVKCAERGIRVVRSTGSNTDSVANHVLAQYFACRRRFLPLQHAVFGTDVWKTRGTLADVMKDGDGKPPKTCQEEVVGIIGHGLIGRRVEQMCQALGMKTLIAERKKSASSALPDGLAPFTQVLAQSSVIVLCLPRNPETMNLISDDELRIMSPHCVLVNVSRGDIVNEPAILKALRNGSICGYAADVFLREPSGAGAFWEEGDSPLLRVSQREAEAMNLLVTPHLAWCSKAALDNHRETLARNIFDWCEGKPSNVVV